MAHAFYYKQSKKSPLFLTNSKECEILDFGYYGKTEKYEEKLKDLKQQAQRSCEEVEKLQKILDDFTKESF